MGNPLFYKNIVALNSEVHRELRMNLIEKPLDFAAEANLIPAIVDEFELAAGDLPIAFLPGEKQPAAVFITGLKPGRNFFVTNEGLWSGNYAPAYLRRYPFIVGDVPDGEPVLCFDESYVGLNDEDGARLFSEIGELEDAGVNALTLAQSYREAAEETDEFGAMLKDMNLLRSVTLDSKLPDGETSSVHGLLVVDEEAFSNLTADQLFELHQKGFLNAIVHHLSSLRLISALAPKEVSKVEGKPEKVKVGSKKKSA
ncbi:MAG: SapC family protein [Rhodobacterales bacterium]